MGEEGAGSGLSEKIDSHMSYIANKRINDALCLMDQNKYLAMQDPTAGSIQSYFNAIDVVFTNVQSILGDKYFKKIQGVVKLYEDELVKHLNGQIQTNMTNFFIWLQIVKQFHLLLIQGLQEKKYFFRIGVTRKTGFDSINDFAEHSVFRRGKDIFERREEMSDDELKKIGKYKNTKPLNVEQEPPIEDFEEEIDVRSEDDELGRL